MLDPTPHLERFSTYEEAAREFRWGIPDRMNLAATLLRRHADPVTTIALSERRFGGINTYTFGGLDYLSDKFATALAERNINVGNRVVIALPPSAALAVAHFGCLKMGSVIVPLAPFAKPGFIQHVVEATNANAIILEESLSACVGSLELPTSVIRFEVRDLRPTSSMTESTADFWSEINRCSSDFEALEVETDSPAFVFFVSREKENVEVVHSVRSVICQLSAFEFFNEPRERGVYWAGDDWYSALAVLGVLYPAWWYGASIVANSSAGTALDELIRQCEVTDVFVPSPPVLSTPGAQTHRPADAGEFQPSAFHPSTQSISGTLPAGSEFREVYGTAETGWIFGVSTRWIESHIEPFCRVVPGRAVEIIDSAGRVLPVNNEGQIAIHSSDAGLFSESTGPCESSASDWFLIGKTGYKDEKGELHVEY